MPHYGSSLSCTVASIRFGVLGVALCFLMAAVLPAQDTGPLSPPPEHHVTRIEGVPEPAAPPSLPPAQIIQAFSKKEETYQTARPQFSYRKTIHIQEFGPDGHPAGEYLATYDAVRAPDGRIYEKGVSAPQSSLEYLSFEPEDAQVLTRVPAFPVTASQLSKYDVKYLNTEKIDEIDCYIFQVSPRTLERQHPLFDGIIWVDQKYLEVVKTYGKWVTDLGAVQTPTLPFDMFETYRENVDGKYWFPDYSRADGTYKMKDREIPIRVIVKWTDFKPFPPSAAPATSNSTPSTQPTPAPSSSTAPKP
ncbi:MAG: hypothetical protein WBQ61_21810 [Candidatus Acidiferrum sp.]